MEMLDGTYDGGGDDLNDDFSPNEVDEMEDGYGDDFDYPQQEEYENDSDNFESHQCALDMDYGDGDY